MASGNAVWGIEVGQCALKAVKLRPAGDGKVEVVAFDIIEHAKILSQPDAEPDELIKAALEKFASRNDWQGDKFVIGVPGQQTFARFCKLPPADPKKIPDLVKYEAGQQIPFDMDDVVWDYQVFQTPDSPDIEVGIFAMRKDLIRKHIDYYSAVGIAPMAIQTIPSALYNFARFDGQGEGDGATVLVDVGAQNTDLIVVEKNSAWTRNIPLGGNSFTDALIKSFKLSFAKAESLKRTAATSKYARQIFQAMRPIFAELVAEVQRSLGFYASTHREVELARVLALGNAFRLPGLQKYLENNLTISGGVAKLEKFNNLLPSATLNAPQFSENVLSLGAAYGLAIQGLGLGQISASLLPTELARVAAWKKKQPYFIAAAASLLLAAAFPWTRGFLDKNALASSPQARQKTDSIIAQAQSFANEFQSVTKNTGDQEEAIKKLLALQKDKLIVPRVIALVHEAMPEPVPGLDKAQTPEQLKNLVKSDPAKYARTKRKELHVENFNMEFSKNIEGLVPSNAPSGDSGGGGSAGLAGVRPGGNPRAISAPPTPVETTSEGGDGAPGFYVHLSGRLLFGDDQPTASAFLEKEYFANLAQLGSRAGLGFYVLDEDQKNERGGKKNLRTNTLQKYVDQRGPGAGIMNQPTPAPRPGAPAGKPAVEDPEAKQFEDPITKEDTRTDWRFDIGFKVRLGEKPPAKPNAAGQPPGQG